VPSLDPGEAGEGLQGGTWNRAVLLRGPGGSGFPPAFLILILSLTLGGGVESLFLTSPSCSLRG
jgi:hypothetical protein